MLTVDNLKKNELQVLSGILMKMQSQKNNGSGLPHVQTLATFIKRGLIKEATNYAVDISGKLWDYPDIRRFVHDMVYPIGYIDNETGLFVNDSQKGN